jgi:hypothetical protein
LATPITGTKELASESREKLGDSRGELGEKRMEGFGEL